MADEPHEQATTPDDLSRTYAAMLGEDFQSPAMSEAIGGGIDEPLTPNPSSTRGAEENDTPPQPLRIIEALLFVGGSPLTTKRAREILRGLTEEQFDETINQLNADYRRQARPYALQPQGAGWVLTLRPRFRHVIEKLYGGVREARLSTAAIDVLALVAYCQPVTKPNVDTLRGAESAALLRQLVRRGLIQIVPVLGAATKEVAYATTQRFLEMVGLQNLDDLPKTHDLQQI